MVSSMHLWPKSQALSETNKVAGVIVKQLPPFYVDIQNQLFEQTATITDFSPKSGVQLMDKSVLFSYS